MDGEIILDTCPECGEDEQEVLHGRPQTLTIRCLGCGAVRSINPPKQETTIDVNTVVSDEDRSWNVQLPTGSREEIRVGDEFELDGHRMIVTAIELDGQQKAPKAMAPLIRNLFAKVFDTVPLKISINEGEVTKSHRLDVDPDMQVPIGLVLEVDGQVLAVKTLKSDQNRTLHKGFLLARNIRRAFCDPAPRRAKAGDVVETRPRGRREGEPSKGPSPRIKGPRGQRSRSPKR